LVLCVVSPVRCDRYQTRLAGFSIGVRSLISWSWRAYWTVEGGVVAGGKRRTREGEKKVELGESESINSL